MSFAQALLALGVGLATAIAIGLLGILADERHEKRRNTQ